MSSAPSKPQTAAERVAARMKAAKAAEARAAAEAKAAAAEAKAQAQLRKAEPATAPLAPEAEA